MQTIKGLIALLLVALAVFTAVTLFNRETNSSDEASVETTTVASNAKAVKQTSMGKTSSLDTHQKNSL